MTGELLHRVEVDVFGFHHGQVGAVQEAVAWHHNPRMATRYPVEAAAVHVADHVANAFQLGTSGKHLVPPLAAEAWSRLELAPDALPAILHKIESVYRDALAAMLGSDA